MKDLKEFVAKIRELPDNPNIKHLDSNCYTINIKELSKHHILSATYYDFKFQYSIIIQMIESEPIETSAKHIDTILKSPHRITYKGTSIKFHPDVVKQLKSIVGA